ncbi:phosphoglucosamine mutase [Holospora obtusa F1]|uniref:Phosphoglucosamine mutase n=1 Tax=Holospora obtusa F1 TaxID=1399147 RepID=W6TDD4_HOLOB|nr:hypothetical protein [Holospora obtusa]ETZ06751.1 phosphoglucosamine mutase [Holospora obtusa F1]
MKNLRWFGTDGIRGIAFEGLFVPSVLTRVGKGIGEYLHNKFSNQVLKNSLWVLIGVDTRDSGPTFAASLISGLQEYVGVGYLGVCSSGALAWLTRYYGAHFGIMVSASHNSAIYNGIKCFDSDGSKFSVEDELEIEDYVAYHLQKALHIKDSSFLQVTHSQNAYQEALTFGRNLKGLRVILDGAHGSLWKFASDCFTICGAEVVSVLGADPNGRNINENSGVLYPSCLQNAVINHCADLGFCFDGDGDRVGVVDNLGKYWDGDQILAALSKDSVSVVGTVMSNYGLERYFLEKGKSFFRVDVGDRWISQALKTNKLRWGGESSGHLIDYNFLPVGDGLWIALEMSSRFIQEGKVPIFPVFSPYPVLQKNIPISGNFSLNIPEIQSRLCGVYASLSPDVRLVLRPSGTEPVIRILLEGLCVKTLKFEMERVVAWISEYMNIENAFESNAA